MNKKDNKPDKKSDSFSSSAQIFEDIFKDATQSAEKTKVGKPQQEGPRRPSAPLPAQSRQVRPPKSPAADTKPVRKEAQPRLQGPKSRLPEKPARKSSLFKLILLVVLLAVMAGALVNYLGVFDVTALFEMIGMRKKETAAPVVQKQIPKAQTASKPDVKKPGEKVDLTKSEEAKKKRGEPSSSVQGKEAAPGMEVAKPTALPPVTEQGVIKAPVPAQQIQVKEEKPAPPVSPLREPPKKEASPITTAQNPQATSPVSQSSPLPQSHSKAIKPEPIQPTAQAKSSSIDTPAPPESSARYPYSIYLGSFQTHDMAKKILSTYKEEGSPAYWSKVKLGDKGVWYRIYIGYFRSEAEARDFISKRQIKDAEVKTTKYAVLLGVFPTRAEAEQKISAMLGLGFPAYIISEPQGKMRLYSGAFLTKEGADMALSELAAKGIRASAVER